MAALYIKNERYAKQKINNSGNYTEVERGKTEKETADRLRRIGKELSRKYSIVERVKCRGYSFGGRIWEIVNILVESALSQNLNWRNFKFLLYSLCYILLTECYLVCFRILFSFVYGVQ